MIQSQTSPRLWQETDPCEFNVKNKSPKVGKKTKKQYAEGVFQYGFK